MRNWFRKMGQSEYIRRQMELMSSVGLFYVIIIALFAVPLFATFVVVLIQGVFDFRYVILGGGIVAASLAIFFAAKFFFRLFRRLKKDGALAVGLAKERALRGETVQLELLGGLFSLSYGGDGGKREPLLSKEKEPLLLTDMGENYNNQLFDPIERLKELSLLKEQGIIDNDEFLKLKEKLIRDVCDS